MWWCEEADHACLRGMHHELMENVFQLWKKKSAASYRHKKYHIMTDATHYNASLPFVSLSSCHLFTSADCDSTCSHAFTYVVRIPTIV